MASLKRPRSAEFKGMRGLCTSTDNSRHGYATYGAYHTSFAVAPLATGRATDYVQGGSSGPQVPQRACTSLLG